MTIEMRGHEFVEEGQSAAEAVAGFRELCRTVPGTLFTPDDWFQPFRERLERALPGKLTAVLRDALLDAAFRRRELRDVVEFVEQQPIDWPEFRRWRDARRRTEAIENGRRGIFPWEWVDVALAEKSQAGRRECPRWRSACPRCARPASELTSVHFHHDPREHGCKHFGWLLVCEECRIQVVFLTEMIGCCCVALGAATRPWSARLGQT